MFDFFNPPTAGVVPGAAGHLVLASVSDFPALVGNGESIQRWYKCHCSEPVIAGVALLAGFLGPCGMNTPHTHPRATEFLYLVNGTLQNGMITETGSRFIVNNITNTSSSGPRGVTFDFLASNIVYRDLSTSSSTTTVNRYNLSVSVSR